MENWFVVVMGIVTVFVVLTLIIALCYLLGMLCRDRKEETQPEPTAHAEAQIPNRAELVAALSVAIAEYSGTDASALRIVSIKKI